MRKPVTLMLASAVALFSLAGCDSPTGGDSSSMSLELTDAPAGDLSKAWVQINRITLQGSGGEFVLMDSPTNLVDLLTLDGTTMNLVSDVAIPSGTYTQLRIELGPAAVKTDDGDVFSRGGAADQLGETKTGDLTCPSCTQTGLKVNLPDGGITLESEQKVVLLDFAVSESFGREAGFADRWVMNPVIKTSEIELTGSVAGTVDDSQVSWPTCGGTQTSVEDFVAQLLDSGGGVAYSATPSADGSYEIDFVEPGDYDTGFADQVTFDGDVLSVSANASKSTVTVEQDATSTVDYTVTSVSCGSGSSS